MNQSQVFKLTEAGQRIAGERNRLFIKVSKARHFYSDEEIVKAALLVFKEAVPGFEIENDALFYNGLNLLGRCYRGEYICRYTEEIVENNLWPIYDFMDLFVEKKLNHLREISDSFEREKNFENKKELL